MQENRSLNCNFRISVSLLSNLCDRSVKSPRKVRTALIPSWKCMNDGVRAAEAQSNRSNSCPIHWRVRVDGQACRSTFPAVPEEHLTERLQVHGAKQCNICVDVTTGKLWKQDADAPSDCSLFSTHTLQNKIL